MEPLLSESGRPLHPVRVGADMLFINRCSCGELTVQGFFHQLKFISCSVPKKKLVAEFHCDKCKILYRKVFRLTTSKVTSHRVTNWIRLYFRIASLVWDYFPVALRVPSMKLVLWLENHLPI
jgi:hypothetical protein